MTNPTGAAPDDAPREPLLAEDLLLLLFDPRTGAIAGEGTLFYTLAGAVLAQLAVDERVGVDDRGWMHGRVVHTTGSPPSDPLLAPIWERLARKPREIQALLAEIGPTLRTPLLDRLVARGDIRRVRGKALGLIPTTKLSAGDTPHREVLLEQVRAVLMDGAPATARIAALGALLWASGSLPTLHRDIPWTAPVIARARALQRGDWGAEAVGEAIQRTTTAILTSTLIATGVIAAR